MSAYLSLRLGTTSKQFAGDLLALLEAIALLEDVKVAWQAFEAEKTIPVQDLDAH